MRIMLLSKCAVRESKTLQFIKDQEASNLVSSLGTKGALILLKTQKMMNIKWLLLRWFIIFLIKKRLVLILLLCVHGERLWLRKINLKMLIKNWTKNQMRRYTNQLLERLRSEKYNRKPNRIGLDKGSKFYSGSKK